MTALLLLAPYDHNGLTDEVRNAVKAFDHAVIDAFAAADPGIAVRKPSADGANTGELRVENKLYVLTASRYQKMSWDTEGGPYNYFTKWLTDGVGTRGKMPADTDGNGSATLNELFRYISKVGDNRAFRKGEETHYQHVQVYPSDSGYVLFKR